MTTATAKVTAKDRYILILFSSVAFLLVAIAAVPRWRLTVREKLLGDKKEVLAKINGALSAQGPHVTIFKVINHGSLELEIYTANSEIQPSQIAKISLDHNRDGYFLVKGNATNLALVDMDRDSNLEIVAPTYDEQMVPRLNIFKYNKETQSFDRVSAPEDFKP